MSIRHFATAVTTVATLSLGLVVATPALSGAAPSAHTASTFVKGIDTYVADTCKGDAAFTTDATNQFAQFKALGATSVGLTFPLYTDSHSANTIYARTQCGTIYQSPTPQDLSIIASIAQSDGLTVFFRPYLYQMNLVAENPKYWHGNIAPTNVNLWFANYFATLKPYLLVAQNYPGSSFAIADEFGSMALYPNWPVMISQIQAIYSGALVFTASWISSGNLEQYAGTTLGVDAYRTLPQAKDNWSTEQLLVGWDGDLASNPIPHITKVAIDEVGVPAVDGIYPGPNGSDFDISTATFNQNIQAKWDTMACAFAHQQGMPGIYFWGPWLGTDFGNLPTTPNPLETSNLQPATQEAIKNCFGLGTVPVVTGASAVKSGTTTTVTITGSNFTNALNVTVGGTTATTFTVVNDHKIVALLTPAPKNTSPTPVNRGKKPPAKKVVKKPVKKVATTAKRSATTSTLELVSQILKGVFANTRTAHTTTAAPQQVVVTNGIGASATSNATLLTTPNA